LHRGLRTLLDWLLEQQNQHSPVPALLSADEDVGDQQPDLTPAEIEREEGEDAYWQRLFRSQVRQVLHAFAQCTRFSIFMQSPEDIIKAAQLVGAMSEMPSPLTIREMVARNDARKYLCVEDVRKDFKQIHHNMQVLFSEESNPAECEVRAHASELLDKAEIKLDCIDKEVVKMLERGRRRREQRKSFCEQAAVPNGDTSASPSARGSAVQQQQQQQQPKEQQRPADLPQPLRDAVEHGVQGLLTELGTGECPPPSVILRLGQRVQRNLCLALSGAQHGRSSTGGRQARILLHQLTDAFCHDYNPPESLDGLTAASLLTRRTSWFQKWLAKQRNGIQKNVIQTSCTDIVAALIREEQTLGRLPTVGRLRLGKRTANT